jgi:16S rRNA A1518/A1519 N6-dimethyltransferase RsmA/KsgA/DIM1 with predicted DNA glycosylase/AP lyase activity
MAIDEDPEDHEGASLDSAGVSCTSRRVLEIGCGDGRLTSRLASTAASIVAIDPDAEAVAELTADLPLVDARAVGIEALQLAPQSVDVVVFSWSL